MFTEVCVWMPERLLHLLPPWEGETELSWDQSECCFLSRLLSNIESASVLAGGSNNEQLPYSTWHCRANTPVIFPSGVNQPDFLFSVQNVVNQNNLIQTEWYFGVSTLIFPSSPLLFFFLFLSHICLPKNIIWTEPKWPQAILVVDRSKYPPWHHHHHHLPSSLSIFARLGLSCDSPGWFNMMHVVAKLMFFSKEPKNTALSLGHTTNGHFHVAALAKLTDASTPDSPSWNSGKKTFSFQEKKKKSPQNGLCQRSEISRLLFQPWGWNCSDTDRWQINGKTWMLKPCRVGVSHTFFF